MAGRRWSGASIPFLTQKREKERRGEVVAAGGRDARVFCAVSVGIKRGAEAR
jgi:hypothetical protein